jgi:asparagine synthase (glutamine-hydrolysing)
MGTSRSAIADCRSSTWQGGRQPLRSVDNSIWLVCNGEIYNYVEQRKKLEAAGHRFVTQSDCEVIIGLYQAHGERLLEHLRGMFAFVLWDARNARLLAARDHLGQKPLFYTDEPGRFAFASEIKALLALDPETAQDEPAGAGSVSGAAPDRPTACLCSGSAQAAAGTPARDRARRSARGAPLLGSALPAEA